MRSDHSNTGRTWPQAERADGAEPTRVRRYDELDGAEGRAVYFRPHRYGDAELAPLDATLTVWIDEQQVQCSARDVSQSGVGFAWPEGLAAPPLGLPLDRLAVAFDGHVVYDGGARVGSIRQEEGAIWVGVELREHLLKIDEVLELRDLRRASAAQAMPLSCRDRDWQRGGYATFKRLIGELRLYLEDSESHLRAIESELPWTTVHGAEQALPRQALVDLIKGDFMVDFLAMTEELQRAASEVPAKEVPPLIRYSRRYLDEWFMRSPWMHRARHKPLGYPGDYEVMNHIYRVGFDGPDLMAKAMNLATLHSPAAAAVRNRKDLIRDTLAGLLQERLHDPGVVRVLSVASGPAQEVFELLSEAEELPERVEIVLFDQDPGALAYAYGRLRQVVERRFPGQVDVLFLHYSIKRLLKDDLLFSRFGPFDAIICCGLYDYLRHGTAAHLTGRLFDNLLPGGTAYIGNMHPNNGSRWIMEHHLDWQLLYRTHEQILAFANEGAPRAHSRIVTEPTGVNPFVFVERARDDP